jgi:hypothetical protein
MQEFQIEPFQICKIIFIFASYFMDTIVIIITTYYVSLFFLAEVLVARERREDNR